MSRDTAVLLFSNVRYDFLFQRHQHLFEELTSHYSDSYRFYYINPPPLPTHAASILARSLKNIPKGRTARKEGKNENILTACVFFPTSFWGIHLPAWLVENSLSVKLFWFSIHKALKADDRAHKMVAIVGSPLWEPYVSQTEFDLICYDYIDALEVLVPGHAAVVKKKHTRLIAKSDIVFATTKTLGEDVRSIADSTRIVIVSNGANIAFFERNKESKWIADYRRTNRKTVGYIGSINWWVDLDLVYAAAKKLRDVDFLLIGPFQHPNRLLAKEKPENVFLLGSKDYVQVPAYTNLLDIGLIPFKTGQVTEGTDPIKLYEYFSLGKPVVATRLRPLERLDDTRLLKTADTLEEFVAAINFFLANDSKEWRVARKQIAAQNSWLSKAKLLVEGIESSIDAKHATQPKTL